MGGNNGATLMIAIWHCYSRALDLYPVQSHHWRIQDLKLGGAWLKIWQSDNPPPHPPKKGGWLLRCPKGVSFFQRGAATYETKNDRGEVILGVVYAPCAPPPDPPLHMISQIVALWYIRKLAYKLTDAETVLCRQQTKQIVMVRRDRHGNIAI